ncbi:T9SS type A sorting domain-containing protein [Mariniflexile gromovii]|uniref:T9SS type A sorting domain-containing protein n=1 Tax=Mariniflexile gromovii TaxID=362523 RepID=A0ABS4BXV5_9FLAO|nr:T9SS type A sorting domain-containing protein [Mariniflexile gromovii]MBP0905409.1 T9SS type A sorting domain-containing protein [Mariniflexile gromovii]
MKKIILNALFVVLSIPLVAQNVLEMNPENAQDNAFFKFIPSIDYNSILEQNGTTNFTTSYSPSGSYWLDPTEADEQHVYLAKLEHQASTPENSWQLRIGQGGQIYSFKSAYGEGIPPQSKEHSTWNDEVWQPVSVSTLNNRDFTSAFYFIHGAGAYNNDGIEKTWYSPLMASYYDAFDKSYAVTNWGAQAHIPSLYKSEILYTTKYREIGEGVLEVTYFIQNFGDEPMVHINAPWGGVRASSLRGKFVGLPDGSIEISDGNTGTTVDTRDIDETGGYVIWSENTTNSTAASMGIVFGNKLKTAELTNHGLRNVFFRLGQVGGDTNPRDYTLFTVIAQLDIKRGETFYYRTYYINGTRDFVQEKGNLLAPYSDYGFIEPNADETPKTTISASDSDGGLSKTIYLNTSFTKDMLPIFLMKNTATGKTYISPDPYYNVTTQPLENPYNEGDPEYETYQNRFVYKLHESPIEYVRLLGYAFDKDMSSNPSFSLLDDLILDNAKVILTAPYLNKIWVQTTDSPITATNLALDGVATQSSTLHDAEATRAIDGNTNGAFSEGSVTHTGSDPETYWQVELDAEYAIGIINIFGRTDSCCLERLSNFTVLVYDADGQLTYSETFDAYPDPSVTSNANGVQGKIIKVRNNTGSTLSLAEVQVFEALKLSVTSPEKNINFFPNPVKTSFKINKKNIHNINIYDVSGKLVKNFDTPQHEYIITNLKPGIYFAKTIDTQGKTAINRLIKL